MSSQAGQGVRPPTLSRGCATPNTLPDNWISATPVRWRRCAKGCRRCSPSPASASTVGCKTLTTSNPIESMICIARTSNPNPTRWRDGQMVLRWTAAGMLNAERSFRHIKPTKQTPPTRRLPPPICPPGNHQRHRICRCRRLEFTVDRHPSSTRPGRVPFRAAGNRSPKVIANALSAGFHRIIHRALPAPVGSRERVTK